MVAEPSHHPVLITRRALRQRGWTNGLIKRWLGDPDATAPNPHVPSAASMLLYSEVRASAVERSPEFIAARATATPRILGAQHAVANKRETLLDQIDAMAISVQRVPPHRLRHLAIRHYEAQVGQSVYLDAPQYFIDRITVNFLRYEGSNYDRALEAAAGRVGIADATTLVRRKVLDAIAAAYPELTQECNEQLRRQR